MILDVTCSIATVALLSFLILEYKVCIQVSRSRGLESPACSAESEAR